MVVDGRSVEFAAEVGEGKMVVAFGDRASVLAVSRTVGTEEVEGSSGVMPVGITVEVELMENDGMDWVESGTLVSWDCDAAVKAELTLSWLPEPEEVRVAVAEGSTRAIVVFTAVSVKTLVVFTSKVPLVTTGIHAVVVSDGTGNDDVSQPDSLALICSDDQLTLSTDTLAVLSLQAVAVSVVDAIVSAGFGAVVHTHSSLLSTDTDVEGVGMVVSTGPDAIIVVVTTSVPLTTTSTEVGAVSFV